MSTVEESYKKELKELRFFRDEVLGLFDWGDEEVDMGLDQLNFIRTRLADERKWAKISAKKAAEYEAEKVKLAAYIALQKQSAQSGINVSPTERNAEKVDPITRDWSGEEEVISHPVRKGVICQK